MNTNLIFLKIAENVSEFSKAKRLKVGAIIVSESGKIIGTGYNGTPSGTENDCEDSENKTNGHVIHAELNAILNSTISNLSNSTIYLTHSPCIRCAAAIAQVGIKKVIYSEEYRILDGIQFLNKNDIQTLHLNIAKNTLSNG